MSHTGNIKGVPGTFGGHAPTRPGEGGHPGRVAFGACIALAGAALLVAMLASL